MSKLNNTNVIKNISTDQSEILWNIMQLYNNGQPFDCDMTASELKFYGKRRGSKYEIPAPKILFDTQPINEQVEKITPFQKLPLEDNSIGSIVCDLPFCISPKACKSMGDDTDGSCLIAKRFSSWYPYMEGYENMYWWMKECFRVLKDGGTLVWKMQNTVSGGINHWYSYFSFLVGQKMGFYVIDEFVLQAKARLISAAKIKEQKHARKYTCSFWVMKKDAKNAAKTNCLAIMDECQKNAIEGKVWPIK